MSHRVVISITRRFDVYFDFYAWITVNGNFPYLTTVFTPTILVFHHCPKACRFNWFTCIVWKPIVTIATILIKPVIICQTRC